MNAKQRLLIALYWSLFCAIIVIVVLTLNFFMNAFLLLFVIPMFMAVDSTIAKDETLTVSSWNRWGSLLKKLVLLILGAVVLGWVGFALLWEFS